VVVCKLWDIFHQLCMFVVKNLNFCSKFRYTARSSIFIHVLYVYACCR